jgi:hypothetical protein
MMRLRVTVTVLVLAGVLSSALTAGTAAARPTPPAGQVGCSGNSCFTQLEQLITFTGPGYNGTPNPGVSLGSLPIPACWMEPTFTPAQMLAFYKQMGTDPAYELIITSFNPFYPAIVKYAAANTPGMWWAPAGNPNDPNETSCIAGLPVIEWVAQGAAPAVVANIPVATLALLAYAMFHVPAPKVRLSPNAAANPPQNSYVNLPTFVTVNNAAGELWVTAALGGEQATVAADPSSVNIPRNPPGGTSYTGGCGPGGSRESAAQMASAGAGATPDCGVVYQQPSASGDYPLPVTQTWSPTGYAGGFQAGPINGLGLLPAGTPPLQSPPTTTPVPVAEIQSVNGTG